MTEEKRIASKVILVEKETYYVHPDKCPLREEEAVCCVYSPSNNVYVCPYSGEEVRVNGTEDVGSATSYCTHPDVM